MVATGDGRDVPPITNFLMSKRAIRLTNRRNTQTDFRLPPVQAEDMKEKDFSVDQDSQNDPVNDLQESGP